MNESIANTIQALDSFTFTVKEYFLNYPEIIIRAAQHVQESLDCKEGDYPQWIVTDLLRAKCLSILASNAEWIAIPSDCNSDISCKLYGVLFTGKVNIESRNISVCLEPGGISKRCYLHSCSPNPFIGGTSFARRPTFFGVDSAKRLFLEICGEALSKKRTFAYRPTNSV